MKPASHFNIRVYGIWISESQLLVNEELIRGLQVIKFPGGGMELGEGTKACLAREWKEEMGLEIEVLEHYYTTDFFQQSAFDDSQVVSVYYLVNAIAAPNVITNLEDNHRTFWLPLEQLKANPFSLPIDRIVGQMLMNDFTK